LPAERQAGSVTRKMGLGSRIAARFRGIGLEQEIPERRANIAEIYELVERLVETSDRAEQKHLKEELARRIFGDS